MKIYKLLAVMLAVTALAAGCGQEERSGRETQTEETGGAGSSEQAGQTEPAEEAADMNRWRNCDKCITSGRTGADSPGIF